MALTETAAFASDPNVWNGRRIVVTGGAGFIGSRVVEALKQRGVPASNIIVPRSATDDLRNHDNCRRVVAGAHIVLHLAAPTGGIAFSRAHPASQYRDCTLIDLGMLEAARAEGVERFVTLGNLLAYPAAAPSPLVESSLYDGPVASTHLGIARAKRNLVAVAEMYHREYSMHVTGVLSANAYGPGDRFDPAHSHVIPATIMKCFRDEDLEVWGDGTPTRDFLYVTDVAEGLLRAAERLTPPTVVNLASGREASIAELVHTIARLSGFRREIRFDPSKGGGDPRRVASTTLGSELLDFSPQIDLEEGLARTIEFYRSTRS